MEVNGNNGAAIDEVVGTALKNGKRDPSGRKLSSESQHERTPLLGDGVGSNGSEDGDDDSEEWFGTAELAGLPWWKRPSTIWLLPPYLLYTVAFGGIIVPKMNLILDLVCNDFYASRSAGNSGPMSGPFDPPNGPDRCQNADVSSRSSLFFLYASLISGVLALITAPKLGALSDRYGRKPILLFTATGVFLSEVITIIAARRRDTIDVNWILLSYAVDGATGSFIVGMAVAHSYAADCTPPLKRAVSFGYFYAAMFLGIAIGPILSGTLIKIREPVVGKTEAVLLVFYIALGCHLLFVLLLIFAIPESLTRSRQTEARRKHAEAQERLSPNNDLINRLRHINPFEPLCILWPTGPGSSRALRWNLVLLAATDAIMFGVGMGAMGVIGVYVRLQFGWHEWDMSIYVSIVNVCRVLSLTAILPLITRIVRGGQNKSRPNSGSDNLDLYVIRVAILFDMLGFLGYSVVRNGRLFIASGAFASFVGSIGSPTLSSALTKHVPPAQVGQLLGATGLLHAVARILGPLLFNGIYSATVAKFRQTVFVCLTATFGLAFLCSWFVRPHVHLQLEDDGSPARTLLPEDNDDENEDEVSRFL
ncbi:MFS general substrate transporter [Sporormia fimetaria CBS 119925]|uniref:MFS general substrate transporter n=1 Tax=Sporormia fimetaria CBS 119925 TaxID=1340428 RepID=A0A6A6UZR8_9PLEO|nr:MFS general substrate transporter [Sporormia fimetaria CBS 119925]